MPPGLQDSMQIRGPRDLLNAKRRASSEGNLMSPRAESQKVDGGKSLRKRNHRGIANAHRNLWLKSWKIENAKDPNEVVLLIQKLTKEDPGNSARICSLPPGVPVELWLYEHLRYVVTSILRRCWIFYFQAHRQRDERVGRCFRWCVRCVFLSANESNWWMAIPMRRSCESAGGRY